MTPQTIKVCLCGNPVAPNLGGMRSGRTASEESNSFLASLKGAREYRENLGKTAEPAKIDPSQLVDDFVTRDEYNKLKAAVETPGKKGHKNGD